MPQNIDIPEPVTSVATDKQIVKGPDGKKYVFSKNITQGRIDKYFAKKGIKAPVKKEDNGLSPEAAGKGVPSSAVDKSLSSIPLAATEYGATALPSVGGMAGGFGAGTPGAALGGVIGEDLRQMIMRPILLGRGQQDLDVKQSLIAMGKEGAIQGTLDYAGGKIGEVFFNTLNKIVPHAVTNKGIPLLPGDLSADSKVMKYVESLLSNLAPSAKTMADFRASQTAAISKYSEKLAQGFARFKGTSEEMGILLRNTLRTERDQALKALESIRKSLPKGKQSMAQALKDPVFKKAYEDFNSNFDYQLMRDIVRTNKPELIAGFLRTSKASLGETRLLTDFVHELSPELLGKVQNQIMRDVFQEVMTGSKDPVLRGQLQREFSGSKLKSTLDNIGEQKLKALYGERKYKAITDFSNLVGYVDKTQGGGAGRFLNLLFILPFRSGASAKAVGKTAMLGIVFNRAAKIITSPEGVKMYENYIRAAASQSPRLLNLAREEIKTYNERSDAEYDNEQKQAEEEFKKQQVVH